MKSMLALVLAVSAAAGSMSMVRAGENLTVTTLAGADESPNSVDGPAGTSRFAYPGGVAVDSGGNVYVAESGSVRKVSTSGVVTTLAGFIHGAVDGKGAAARFDGLAQAAVDSDGNIYVADPYKHTIRKVAADGTVSTLAGSAGNSGSADGAGSAARFNYPRGLALDGSGNVYVADSANHTIRKITPTGVVSTLAGSPGTSGSADGTGSAARFNGPQGVAVDGSGNVYIADTFNDTIRKITPGGEVTTLAGSAGSHGPDDGTGSAARFWRPKAVVLDGSGNAYVADASNSTIRKVTPTGEVSTLAGLAGKSGCADGNGSAARFANPNALAIDGSGDLYVSDGDNCTIRKVTPAGAVTTLAGSQGNRDSSDGTGALAQFYMPRGVAVDGSGNIYVADWGNNTIRKISAGVVTTLAGLAGAYGGGDGIGNAARFNEPSGVAVDGSGNVYVADCSNNTIRKITAAGEVSTLAGLAGSSGSADGTGSAARFNNPEGIAADSSGNLYVADTWNHTIRKITPAGDVTTLAGSAGNQGGADGTGTAARFRAPEGIAIDGSGNIYVADTANHAIRKITPAGVVTTVAGVKGFSGTTDGPGTSPFGALFESPRGIAEDGSGNLYVGSNGTIRRVTSSGVVSTVAGLPFPGLKVSGTGGDASFWEAWGLAVGTSGKIYFAEEAGVRIAILGIPDAATIDQGNGAVGAVRQLDTVGQTATSWQWSLIRRPSGSTAELSSATVRNPTFTPDVADVFIFRLVATDATGRQSLTTVDLVTTSSCHAPIASDQITAAAADGTTSITLGVTDADNDALQYWIVSRPSHGTLGGQDQHWQYTPDAGYTGPDSFAFRARDSQLNSNVATVSLMVTHTYAITASAGANGSISPSGAVTVNEGNNQAFTITPDANYAVLDVLVDGASVGAVTGYTFTNVTADHTISATFSRVNELPVAVADVSTPGHTVTVGTPVTLTGSSSYDPDNWPGGGIQSYSWAQEAGPAVTLDAVMEPQFTPTLAGVYTFKLTVNDGADDSTDASSPDNRVTVTVNDIVTHTITASAGAGGAISPSGSVVVVEGTDQAFNITANAGYVVSDILVDGLSVGPAASYTFVNVIADHTIAAAFIAVHTITATAGAGGSISPSGAVTVVDGASQGFTVTPSSGYKVAAVTVDGASVGAVASYTFTNVTADHTIAATFKLKDSGGGGGGGGGCSLAAGPVSTGGALGWLAPYLALGGAWLLSRLWRRRRAAGSQTE